MTNFYGNEIYASIIILVQHAGELPVTIDFSLFDRAPGDHNITIIVNSFFGMNEFTSTFFVPGALVNISMHQ
jgi:hypothetical protein